MAIVYYRLLSETGLAPRYQSAVISLTDKELTNVVRQHRIRQNLGGTAENIFVLEVRGRSFLFNARLMKTESSFMVSCLLGYLDRRMRSIRLSRGPGGALAHPAGCGVGNPTKELCF